MFNSFFSFFLGLDAELYYVRNDLISHYALSFNLLVPSETNFLHFTWHAKSKVREWSTRDAKTGPLGPRGPCMGYILGMGYHLRAIYILGMGYHLYKRVCEWLALAALGPLFKLMF